MFEIYGGQKTLKQWSKNHKLVVNELPLGAEVHFYNDVNAEHPLQTGVYDMTDSNGKTIRVCNIPNILLTEANKIKVWVPEKIQGLYGKMHTISIPRTKYITVEPAKKPADYVYEETDLDSDCQCDCGDGDVEVSEEDIQNVINNYFADESKRVTDEEVIALLSDDE